jgi:hypothetical protein
MCEYFDSYFIDVKIFGQLKSLAYDSLPGLERVCVYLTEQIFQHEYFYALITINVYISTAKRLCV